MWIFDGEEWTEDGASEKETAPETKMPHWDEFSPELQVVEHVPTPPATRIRYVPFPIP